MISLCSCAHRRTDPLRSTPWYWCIVRAKSSGGKVEKGETVEAAALRELEEEAGVRGVGIRKRAVIFFWFNPEAEQKLMEVHLYTCSECEGTPTPSEEMTPIQWWPEDELPLDKMWADDRFWMKHILQGDCFVAAFRFSSLSSIEEQEIAVVTPEHLLGYRTS
eukprot:Hpha_TRINITY_DN16706_c0_g1::TRINITY_DN16706_c0_g1_i1::g.78690::m.78690/K17816/NUDT1, MTH1; 8-oxo-dGTP diphosphatase / 2-hydroxy-dATP diphosphatase